MLILIKNTRSVSKLIFVKFVYDYILRKHKEIENIVILGHIILLRYWKYKPRADPKGMSENDAKKFMTMVCGFDFLK